VGVLAVVSLENDEGRRANSNRIDAAPNTMSILSTFGSAGTHDSRASHCLVQPDNVSPPSLVSAVFTQPSFRFSYVYANLESIFRTQNALAEQIIISHAIAAAATVHWHVSTACAF
jgi:hypothetical protein